VCFESLQLRSTQCESPRVPILLAPKSQVSLEVCAQFRTEFLFLFFLF
jgi:hypothetical protein